MCPDFRIYGRDIIARYMADQWLTALGSYYLGFGKESVNISKSETLGVLAFDDFDEIVKKALNEHPKIAAQFSAKLNDNNIKSKNILLIAVFR